MIPADVNVEDLSAQLLGDSVAATNPDLAHDAEFNSLVASTLRGNHGFAVVDVPVDSPADARDLAQVLQDSTGFDTVFVQVPQGISAVSHTYDRAAIEAAQMAIAPGTEQVLAVGSFYRAVDQAGAPIALIAAALLMAALCVAARAFQAAGKR